MLAHFYIAVYILAMTPCESFLLAKNGSLKLKQLALITLLLLEYIYKSANSGIDPISIGPNLLVRINDY